MKPDSGEFNFSPPCFKSYLLEIDTEFKEHLEQMLKDAFLKLCFSEKLMLRPFIELKQLRHDRAQALDKQHQILCRKIKAHLSVMNENGDIQVLVKRFNILLFDLSRKKSCKALAKMGAESLLKFIEELKNAGELEH